MTNPYKQAGRVAVGDRFIGRAALVRQVAGTWQDAGRPSNLRVVGHHRVGKTSAVRRAIDTSPPRADLVTVWLNVGNQDSDMDLFRSMVRRVLDETRDDRLSAVAGAIQTATVWYDLLEGVRAFFAAVRARGLNVVVILDEFDRAATAFTRLAPFQLLRDLASEADYSLGLITVSRQNIEKIEVDAAGGSILGGVVSTARYVGMFTEAEVDIMLARAAASGIGLASVRDEIVSRTGQGDSKIANGSHVVTVSNRTSHADGCAAAAAAPWINFPSHGRITRRWPSLFRDDGCFHAIIDPERRPSWGVIHSSYYRMFSDGNTGDRAREIL